MIAPAPDTRPTGPRRSPAHRQVHGLSGSKHASARSRTCRGAGRAGAGASAQVTSGFRPAAVQGRVGSKSYNDPLNKQDPLGLRPDDLNYSDPCFEQTGSYGTFFEDGSCFYKDTGLHRREGIDRPMTGAEVEYCFGSMTSWGDWGIPDLSSHLPECGLASVLAKIAKQESLLRFSATGTCSGVADLACIGRWQERYPRVADRLAGMDQAWDDSLGNAFQHAGWNALMTVYLGSSVAEQIATRHEMAYGWDDDYVNHSRQMDMANNWYGREIGKRIADRSGLRVRIRTILDEVEDFVRAGKACTVLGSVDQSGARFSSIDRCGG